MMGAGGEKPFRVRITQLSALFILSCCEAHVSRRWHRTGFSPVGALTQSPVCELGAARQSCPAGTAPLPRPAGGAVRCAPEAASKCPPEGLAGGSSWGRPTPPRTARGGGRAGGPPERRCTVPLFDGKAAGPASSPGLLPPPPGPLG